MTPLAAGQTLLERFTLLRPLGRGGMGEVWLVRDRELGEEVVAKFLRPGTSADGVELLRRECRQARRLSHPNVVRVHDLHRDGERVFVTMAHVAGEPPPARTDRSPAAVVELARAVAAALEHAHALGVVHRDLRAGNLLVDAGGRVHVLDFGISARHDAAVGERVPRGGGSRSHTGPQQLAGEPPSVGDDLYGLGAVLHELLVGCGPGEPGAETVWRARSDVPARLRTLVERLLESAPDRRPGLTTVTAELEAVARELDRRPARDAARAPGVTLAPPPRAPLLRPALAPVRRRERPGRDGDDSRRLRWLTGAAVTALLVVAAFVFLVLPGWVTPATTPPTAPSTTLPAVAAAPPRAATAPVTSGADGAFPRERVDPVLQRVLESRRALAASGVALWGGAEWERAEAAVDRGDAALQEGRHRDAVAAYGDAAERLERLRTRTGAVLADALARGRRALSAGDAAAAAAAFSLAAAVAPDSAEAAAGLARAGVLDDVLVHVDRAAEQERRGALDDAARSYRAALALDERHDAARRGLARVQERRAADAFAAAMSAGLGALARADHAAARTAFAGAERLRPDAPELADALTRLEQEEQLAAIEHHRARAAALVEDERWHDAAAAYEAALALDPTLQFARAGAARSRDRAELADALAAHVAQPDRLSADAVLAEAEDVLERAREVEDAGPRHRAQVGALAEVLERARTRVPVVLVSDDATEVTVYGVGRLGTFARRTLELRPGTYTVVGARHGYRDVRHELVVTAAAPPEPLVVRCEEEV